MADVRVEMNDKAGSGGSGGDAPSVVGKKGDGVICCCDFNAHGDPPPLDPNFCGCGYSAKGTYTITAYRPCCNVPSFACLLPTACLCWFHRNRSDGPCPCGGPECSTVWQVITMPLFIPFALIYAVAGLTIDFFAVLFWVITFGCCGQCCVGTFCNKHYAYPWRVMWKMCLRQNAYHTTAIHAAALM